MMPFGRIFTSWGVEPAADINLANTNEIPLKFQRKYFKPLLPQDDSRVGFTVTLIAPPLRSTKV
jgi:hypothetical protein